MSTASNTLMLLLRRQCALTQQRRTTIALSRRGAITSTTAVSFSSQAAAATTTTDLQWERQKLDYDKELINRENFLRQQQQEKFAAQREKYQTKGITKRKDPFQTDEMMDSATKQDFDDLPVWQADYVSKISLERLHVLNSIPTLDDLAQKTVLPAAAPAHPAQHAAVYALHRKRQQYQQVKMAVTAIAAPQIPAIQALKDADARQAAVDVLFERTVQQVREQESVLNKHPLFETWVERALEEYLKSLQQQQKTESNSANDMSNNNYEVTGPVFMDCYQADLDTPAQNVPHILFPLGDGVNHGNYPRDITGQMVEEWELAAHKTTKRIMLRPCMVHMASLLSPYLASNGNNNSGSTRILVTGPAGVGKTAAVAAMVASSRTAGALVWYMPEGNQWHQHGYYIEPNAKTLGNKDKQLFDLPVLSQRACQQFLKVHEKDLGNMMVPVAVMMQHATDDQVQRLLKGEEKVSSEKKDSKKSKQPKTESPEGSNKKSESATTDHVSLVDLLRFGVERTNYAAVCYSIAMDYLMHHQTDKAFFLVLDEFNCYFKPSRYYHADYDETVKKAIPYNQITLFKPALDAMALTVEGSEQEHDHSAPSVPLSMKRGAVIAAVTESHAVARAITDGMTAHAVRQQQAQNHGSTMHHVAVPRFSATEVEHMLAHYEAIGVGKLRMDRGATVMNSQEVAYLRMVSGGIAQKLLDACIF